ncbi:GIY-YIG nuclease family protein [Raineyella sp. W15-4]|uniref:GIY-YIG nuclease family protein n=1 Tax=Raineyella sp. W15-4 TaxID=3081651 RepID=UPI0029546144|nr:GIY-YIG nuclease family protein [Raineyella sp. W15-4]WOQ15999.1 GIY-YIG nuclease family protein [Raineyella sp. W15-4]
MRFTRWSINDAISLSVYTSDACGIYVLEFADGEEYVGQTVHLLSRFSAHRRRWPGEIVAVRFREVAPELLDDAERDVVALLVRDGARLRNVDLIGLPLRSPELDHYVDPVDVEDWLTGDSDASNIGDRGVIAMQRQRTRNKFAELAARPDYEAIRGGLARYVALCIPYPHRTERKIWVVTSLPTTGRSAEWRRLAAISVSNVEALVIGEVTTAGGERAVCGFANLARLDAVPPELSEDLSFQDGEYGKTGAVTQVWFDDLEALGEVLDDEALLDAARRFSVGLLRKGGGMFSRFHDYHLADDLFATIECTL